jgi:hypothetical protein
MVGDFRQGDRIEKDEEFIVFPGGSVGYTIDFITDEDHHFEKIIVWEDDRLRDRIVELLNRYGEKDA